MDDGMGSSEWQNDVPGAYTDTPERVITRLVARIEAQAAEIERLRAALIDAQVEIENVLGDEEIVPHHPECNSRLNDVADAISAALSGGDDE